MKTVRYNGFTLVEMMVTMAVLAVLLTVAVPGFTNLIKNNRMLTEVYAIRAALNGARSEAVAQRRVVTFCHSDDGASCGGGWKQGYIAFIDEDGDGVVDDPNTPAGDQVFFAKVVDATTMDVIKYVDFSGSAASRVQFNSRGYARGPGGSSSGTFTVCDDRGATEAAGLIVTQSGIVRAALDPNDTGIPLDLGGSQLVCP